jgi:hypothetical protein
MAIAGLRYRQQFRFHDCCNINEWYYTARTSIVMFVQLRWYVIPYQFIERATNSPKQTVTTVSTQGATDDAVTRNSKKTLLY